MGPRKVTCGLRVVIWGPREGLWSLWHITRGLREVSRASG